MSFIFRLSWNKKLFLLYLFFLLIITFFVLELTFRHLYPESILQSDDIHYPMPYIEFAGRPGAQICSNPIETFNSLGFKGELPIFPKPNGEYRIFMLGGSVVLGSCPIESTIPKRLERNLREKGYNNVKVYNFGVGSFNSAQELTLLIHTLVDYAPDMIIVLDGANEFQPVLYDPRPNYPYNYLVKEKSYLDLQNIDDLKFTDLVLIFLKKSYFLDKLMGDKLERDIFDIPGLRSSINYGSPEWQQEIGYYYQANIMKMNALSNVFHYKFIVIQQPIVNFKEPLIGKEKFLNSTASRDNKLIYLFMSKRLNDIEQKTGGDFFWDFTDIFDGNENEIFWDVMHITDEGNEIIAKDITEIVIKKASASNP